MIPQHAARAPFAAVLLLAASCSSSAPPAPQHPVEAPASDPAAVAARISGDWQFAVERGGRSLEGWLHFALSAGELVGSLTGPDNNPREISKIALKGDKISWQIASESRARSTTRGHSRARRWKGLSRSGGAAAGAGAAPKARKAPGEPEARPAAATADGAAEAAADIAAEAEARGRSPGGRSDRSQPLPSRTSSRRNPPQTRRRLQGLSVRVPSDTVSRSDPVA